MIKNPAEYLWTTAETHNIKFTTIRICKMNHALASVSLTAHCTKDDPEEMRKLNEQNFITSYINTKKFSTVSKLQQMMVKRPLQQTATQD